MAKRSRPVKMPSFQFGGNPTSDVAPPPAVPRLRRSKIPGGLKSDLMKKSVETDFDLIAQGGQRIGCHKTILALRSTVFARMVGGRFKEARTSEAKIDEPHDVLRVCILENLHCQLHPCEGNHFHC